MSIGSIEDLANVEAPSASPPHTMRLFERVQISAMLVGWAYATFTYRTVLAGKMQPFVFVSLLLAITMVVAVLVLQITRRRSQTCKWLLIVISALATAPWFTLLRRIGIVDFAGILALIQGALHVASLGLLVTPSARTWIASRVD